MFNTSREFDITSFDSQIIHKIFHIILESCWEKPLGINAGGEASSVLLKWTCWHLSLFDTNQGSFLFSSNLLSMFITSRWCGRRGKMTYSILTGCWPTVHLTFSSDKLPTGLQYTYRQSVHHIFSYRSSPVCVKGSNTFKDVELKRTLN